jgi:predicted GIY-YIG superfamily endonuclease
MAKGGRRVTTTKKITKFQSSAKPRQAAKIAAPKVQHVVYSLNLADGKKYIGKTDNFKQRMGAHFSGHGAQWTQKNAPVSINHVQVCKTAASQAKAETIVYTKMRDYHGPDLVRGAGNTTSK